MGRNSKPKRKTQAPRKGGGRQRPTRSRAKYLGQDRKPTDAQSRVAPVGRCYHLGRVKLQFRTEKIANKALEQARHRRIAEGSEHIEERSYQCPKCGFWHLTSQAKRTENPS
jgi:rubrerythrin